MTSIKENACICVQCESTSRFCTSNENAKRRHIAIVHGKETFSTLRCGKCQKKYFDMDHFTEHLETSQECRKDSQVTKHEPLSAHLKMAFAALVEQMMRPVETDQMEKAPMSGGNGEGKMDRTSGKILERSMDEVKRKRVEDTNASDDTSLTKRQTRSATSTMKTIGKRKLMKNKKANVNTGPVTKAGKRRRGQRSKDADGSNGSGTGNPPAGGDPNNVIDQFEGRSSRVRREYCLKLIDKFATPGKLRCQLCSVECAATQRIKANTARRTSVPIQHALGHLKMPIYRCQICNITKTRCAPILFHIRKHHPRSVESYEDCADQYQQQIMDMLGQCFDQHKKHTVKQGEHVSAAPVGDSDQKCVNGQFKLKAALVRQEYCLELIDKFSHAGKLQCQLCPSKCVVFIEPRGVMRGGMVTQHALAHLKRPIYRCRICNITRFMYDPIMYHIRAHHPTGKEGYEDCSDQYHQVIMDMVGQCFHMEKKKSAVEQLQKKLAIPAQCYDNTKSPLHSERMHHIRKITAVYSNQSQITCQLCSKTCRLHKANSVGSIRNHVMVHVNKDIFQCILCEKRYQSYYALKAHIRRYHQLKRIEGAYVDYCDKYHQEFVNMLGKCFETDCVNEVVKSEKKYIRISVG